MERPNLVGSTFRVEELDPSPLSTCCLGMPNKSSLLAVGVSSWGWSARGRASAIGVENGSGGGQPRHSVESLQVL